jgi:hypothetical protein
MRKTKTVLWNLFLILAFLLVGCSKDKKSKDDNSTTIDYVSPTLAKDTLIKIPAAMRTKAESGSDINLTIGVAQVDVVNAYSSALSTAFVYDKSSMDGWIVTKNLDGSKTYSWKYLEYTVKLTYYHTLTESWWKYEEDSASYALPFYYINDKGTSGEITWYQQQNFKGQSRPIYKDIWTKSGTTYNSTFNLYQNDGSTIDVQYVSVSNGDKSGTLKVYGLNTADTLVLQWEYAWDAAGSGTYKKYKDDGTTTDFTGTF